MYLEEWLAICLGTEFLIFLLQNACAYNWFVLILFRLWYNGLLFCNSTFLMVLVELLFWNSTFLLLLITLSRGFSSRWTFCYGREYIASQKHNETFFFGSSACSLHRTGKQFLKQGGIHFYIDASMPRGPLLIIFVPICTWKWIKFFLLLRIIIVGSRRIFHCGRSCRSHENWKIVQLIYWDLY